jgi:hypothetical protein
MIFRDMTFKDFDILRNIRMDIRMAKDDQDRRQIVQWLTQSVPDPLKEHNLTRDEHEATTVTRKHKGCHVPTR